MMKPTEQIRQGVEVAAELKRIVTSGALAFLLLMLAVLLDAPVSFLAWMLLAVAFLCLAYVVMATRQLLNHFRSQERKAESHD
jgi:phosphatidylglycerophosphate synthase